MSVWKLSSFLGLSKNEEMIESKYWRDDLLIFSEYLLNQPELKEWSEKEQVIFEKKVIMHLFIARKLMETKKVPKTTRIKPHNLVAFPRIKGKKLYPWDYLLPKEVFDFHNPEQQKLTTWELANQFIHSLILYAHLEKNRWDHILTCSDFKYPHFLYRVEVTQLAHVFREIGEKYPEKLTFKRNNKSGGYDIET